jgi:hypothetical protein
VDAPSIAAQIGYMYPISLTLALRGVCAPRAVAEEVVANGVDSDDGAGGWMCPVLQ